jgi:hypothetical protein
VRSKLSQKPDDAAQVIPVLAERGMGDEVSGKKVKSIDH